jgi:hypothetical protein
MLWPQPINVRMNRVRANQLLNALGQCNGSEDYEIADYPEYAERLNAAQTAQLGAVADRIVKSHDTTSAPGPEHSTTEEGGQLWPIG